MKTTHDGLSVLMTHDELAMTFVICSQITGVSTIELLRRFVLGNDEEVSTWQEIVGQVAKDMPTTLNNTTEKILDSTYTAMFDTDLSYAIRVEHIESETGEPQSVISYPILSTDSREVTMHGSTTVNGHLMPARAFKWIEDIALLNNYLFSRYLEKYFALRGQHDDDGNVYIKVYDADSVFAYVSDLHKTREASQG